MIIRPVCRRNFVALPNVVLTDERLSIETRGMIAYLLSRPANWQIKTIWLAHALSKKGQALGRTKLTRMLREAKTAGYLARSAEQERKPNGDFGSYIYIIGLPEEVQLASARLAHSLDATSQDTTSQNEHRIDKRRTLQNQNSKSIDLIRYGSHPLPLPIAVAVGSRRGVVAGLVTVLTTLEPTHARLREPYAAGKNLRRTHA
jgi:hypothetical protein